MHREKDELGMRNVDFKNSIVVLLTLAVALLTGCCSPFYDDLSECHEVTLEYRYIPVAEDQYSQYITGMRHFLFDGEGNFVRELPQNATSPQKLRIKGLSKGHYTVVTVGNSTVANTFLTPLVAKQSLLSDFVLQLKRRASFEEAYAHADELFWNTKSFEITGEGAQHYVCDLANIHCHLFFQVSWQSTPPAAGNYQIELTNLSEQYALDPAKSSLTLEVNSSLGVVHTFPLHGEKTHKMLQVVALFNHQLTGEFISLRYKNDRIPTFQVKKDGEAITRQLPLAEAFEAFGWIPDRRPVQIYRIQIRINDNGSVTIRPWYEGSVEDWQAGGTVFQ